MLTAQSSSDIPASSTWSSACGELSRIAAITLDGRTHLVALLRSDDVSVIEAAQSYIERRDLPLRTIRWRDARTDHCQGTHVLQLHGAAVDKWQGLCDIADRHGIARERIAVIGDEINDVTMVREAACGIAMGNAIEAVKAVADYAAPASSDDGVAYAVERLLAGAW